jgi:glycosyltransferase involved in cell wall biosynthesis
MNAPFFSVLLPVYNAMGHVHRALHDLLAQSFTDFEILVVDDGSTDGSDQVVRRFNDPRIRLISLERNGGLVGALNAGLAEARGVWIARQDADDRCCRERLERQRDLIHAHPQSVLFYSRARLINERGWWRGTVRPPLDEAGLRWDLCFRNAVPHTSAVFPSALVRDQLNGYDGDNVTADFGLWSRLLSHGGAVGDRRCLVSYRNHSGSIMGQEHQSLEKRSNQGLLQILKKNLRDWAGATEAEAVLIATAWLDPVRTSWEEYFLTRERLVSCALQPMNTLIAEEDYTLMHLAAGASSDCASSMLRAMRSAAPKRYAFLPQPRTTVHRILKGF